jgi:hypothetical protein
VQCRFGGIIGQADPAFIEKPREGRPAPQHVVDCLGGVGVARQPGALGSHPAFQCGNQGFDPFLSDGMPPLGPGVVDLRSASTKNVRRPWAARRFGDPAGWSLGDVEIIEAGPRVRPSADPRTGAGVGLQGGPSPPNLSPLMSRGYFAGRFRGNEIEHQKVAWVATANALAPRMMRQSAS